MPVILWANSIPYESDLFIQAAYSRRSASLLIIAAQVGTRRTR